ncbi:asparaginase-domain-containing protein [Jaminaea rosea]|uniref:asparaginase n=1 Tax=Jaminaea rosea TaxID=1569628 RepID=A0A316UTJ1_9BASI|nr:asparaginase-domain-containing protein [Jaminaea rosea]PWN28607.1 asparaginase-domain-containing protein [Jaminaea rosea]
MAKTSDVLILFAGGTIGMIRGENGYAPYPGFLTETLRTQARFHDVDGSSIFSWSDTTRRFAQWAEAYSQSHPQTRSSSPTTAASSRNASPAPRGRGGAETPPSAGGGLPFGPPFGRPMRVRSSNPKGTASRNAVSSKVLPDGTLDMQLPSLITPKSSHNQSRVRYTVLEYDPLLDSSEMGIDDWLRMSRDIELNYANFDAFVILHGTDTMSYTASALSFLLENLGKTVIVTGAQVPLSELRNDAVENLLGALLLASSFIIPEVCLFFASTLYRGNRSSKVSNNALSAFDSPNLPPLARAGISIDVNWSLVERPRAVSQFRAHDRMSSNVALLRLFPGMPTDTVRRLLSSDIEGLCLESFGAGNAPSRPDLLEAFKDATDRGVVIVNITQCLQGEVSAIYAVGAKLAAVGVVAGADMTPECALAKLAYLLSKKDLSRAQVRELMGRSIRGELTSRVAHGASTSVGPAKTNMSDLLGRILQRPSTATVAGGAKERDEDEDGLASSSPSSEALEREIASAELAMLPYLVHRAADAGDTDALSWHLEALQRLQAAAANAKTGSGGSMVTAPTPATTQQGQGQATVQHGGSQPAAAPSAAASTGGSSATAVNSTGTSPLDSSLALHIASTRGHTACVSLLLEAGCSVHLREPYAGRTPLFLAASNGHVAVVRLLKKAGAHLSPRERQGARFRIREAKELKTKRRGRSIGPGESEVDAQGNEAQMGDEERQAWREAGVDDDGDDAGELVVDSKVTE